MEGGETFQMRPLIFLYSSKLRDLLGAPSLPNASVLEFNAMGRESATCKRKGLEERTEHKYLK